MYDIGATPAAAADESAEAAAILTSTPPDIADSAVELGPLPSADSSGKSLGWRIFTNTASQVIGRNLIALGRLVVAGVIARGYGRGVFGEYSLLFGLLTIAEWVLDFGTTEIFVREICREPERRSSLMRMVTASKIVQIPAAFAVLTVILLALRYPPHVIEAGLVGGGGLIFFAGVLIYRVIFKSSLTMGREVGAELVSVLVMVPMVIFVAHHGGGLISLLACHLISRAFFFAACMILGRDSFRISLRGVSLQDVKWSLQSSAAIGVIGLLVVVNETIDILLLSRLASISDVAFYSAAQRFTMPLLIALASIGATLYPVAATYWPHAPKKFEEACQQGFNTVFLIAGLAISALVAGPNFFMGLLGPSLLPGSKVLIVLGALCFVKAISSALGPVLYIVRAQTRVLQLVIVSVLVKASVLAYLAPRYGAMGVAFGAIAVELCFTAIPAIYLIQRYSGCRMYWTVPVKVILATVVSVGLASLVRSNGGLLAGLVAPAIYTGLVFMIGAASLTNVRILLRRKT